MLHLSNATSGLIVLDIRLILSFQFRRQIVAQLHKRLHNRCSFVEAKYLRAVWRCAEPWVGVYVGVQKAPEEDSRLSFLAHDVHRAFIEYYPECRGRIGTPPVYTTVSL